ncbi:GNAT family N-acetyltransferase [Methylobacterium terricola]|uniref:GNAT family N-acetyltransferase n=1 Tax=Methylobacterium terricola TaxID=2583531 RepID=A0A5C4LI45_9HYPH|nr:GNAT family N-acetyltransferase [Methylobacterium terricola]TNC12343.1 GNAT family N-acetyltransferase [Methylobacterium terricola]
MTSIEILSPAAAEAALPDLAALLHACVLDGASIGFVLPFALPEAEAFWRDGLPALQSGARRLLVARDDGRIVGSTQVGLAGPPNGRHRAEITKVLVHPDARRRGLGRALMLKAEAIAAADGRSLLILDTRSDDAGEALYRSPGYAVTGVVPDYACSPRGVPEACTFMHKRL